MTLLYHHSVRRRLIPIHTIIATHPPSLHASTHFGPTSCDQSAHEAGLLNNKHIRVIVGCLSHGLDSGYSYRRFVGVSASTYSYQLDNLNLDFLL
ncbi:hypothetical protein FRC08_003152 [Ceratobasidium sp. 394]|nr:hypothetical protein FRC08_003152 [Ceratobasidium sp. 394]